MNGVQCSGGFGPHSGEQTTSLRHFWIISIDLSVTIPGSIHIKSLPHLGAKRSKKVLHILVISSSMMNDRISLGVRHCARRYWNFRSRERGLPQIRIRAPHEVCVDDRCMCPRSSLNTADCHPCCVSIWLDSVECLVSNLHPFDPPISREITPESDLLVCPWYSATDSTEFLSLGYLLILTRHALGRPLIHLLLSRRKPLR